MKLRDEKLFRQQCYIDGAWVDALNRGTIPVTNPATGETLGTVPRMGAEETRQANEAADRALPRQPGKARSAASIAWRVSSAPIRGTVPKVSPVAGLVTGIVPRFNASTHSPLT